MERKVRDIIYRLRKSGGVKINTKTRTIYYEYQNEVDMNKMHRKAVERLCKEFGFVRQAEIV
ncbi:hypothetical protein JCM30204_42140 [Dysgonomonas termitidis]